jgi:hypothetical protein
VLFRSISHVWYPQAKTSTPLPSDFHTSNTLSLYHPQHPYLTLLDSITHRHHSGTVFQIPTSAFVSAFSPCVSTYSNPSHLSHHTHKPQLVHVHVSNVQCVLSSPRIGAVLTGISQPHLKQVTVKRPLATTHPQRHPGHPPEASTSP